VRVLPRASREGTAGVRNGALVVRLTAPPVEGKANAALTRFLGRLLRVPPSSVEIVGGESGRDKLVHVAGTSAAWVRGRLAASEESA
jgi:uncharacterized protein (TIGR00251 family)